MRKAQSLIVQFTLFFIIGFGVFLTIGTVFKIQSESFRDNAADSTMGLVGSYFSSALVNAVDTCKQCDYVQYKLRIEKVTSEYFFEVGLENEKGMTVRDVPRDKTSESYTYNFNESFDMNGVAATIKTINLTYNRTKNELRVE